MNKLCIIGANETAERVMLFCERYNLYDIIAFAVDREYIRDCEFLGKPIFPIDELDRHIDKEECFVFVALFWNHLNGDRRRLYERMKSGGWHFASIISPLASVRGVVGENCWIMDYVVVQEGSIVMDDVFIVDFCLVGNSAKIESHVFLGARSTIMGSAHIGEQTFVGTGATIFDVVKIGKKCLVGACSIQKYDIPDCSVCKVTMKNSEIKQYSEEEIEMKWVACNPNRINKNRS